MILEKKYTLGGKIDPDQAHSLKGKGKNNWPGVRKREK